MAKKQNKNLVKIDGKNVLKELQKEMTDEYVQKMKDKIKTKMKEIRMTEIVLEKQKKELNELLTKQYTEEDLLFD